MSTAPSASEPAKQLTKKEQRLLQRQQEEQKSNAVMTDPNMFCDLPLVQSQTLTTRRFIRVGELAPENSGTKVWVRARVHTVRAKGKCAFLLLRQSCFTVQAVCFQEGAIPKEMVKFISGISKESVVDVYGTLEAATEPVESATQKSVEVKVERLFVVSRASSTLPFQLEDASRSDRDDLANVNIDTRLDNRVLDLRTPANQAIMRIQSAVTNLFREFLVERNFVEIHTPKLIAGASEGGSNVFTLQYFGRDACLAQSPQLYKQMTSACGDLERVFEIGPVFRAENSNTQRHLCEFNGLDLEMCITEHYFEVLEVFSDLFIFIFDQLNARHPDLLAAVNAQWPFEPLRYCRPSLRLTFEEGIALLQEAGCQLADPWADLSTEDERWLGRLVRERYDTDFFIMDKYPKSIRPFYTMPCPENPILSNSYDMFIRGQEIVSGAQRIHDVELLQARMREMGVPLEQLKDYIDAFRYGALPHGGGGIGLERVVMLFLGLPNIRMASCFPRDPKRLTP